MNVGRLTERGMSIRSRAQRYDDLNPPNINRKNGNERMGKKSLRKNKNQSSGFFDTILNFLGCGGEEN